MRIINLFLSTVSLFYIIKAESYDFKLAYQLVKQSLDTKIYSNILVNLWPFVEQLNDVDLMNFALISIIGNDGVINTTPTGNIEEDIKYIDENVYISTEFIYGGLFKNKNLSLIIERIYNDFEIIWEKTNDNSSLLEIAETLATMREQKIETLKYYLNKYNYAQYLLLNDDGALTNTLGNEVDESYLNNVNKMIFGDNYDGERITFENYQVIQKITFIVNYKITPLVSC